MTERNEHLDEGMIHAWLDGALSPDESARMESHANSCADCAALVAEARGLVAASSRILASLDAVPAGVIPEAVTLVRINWLRFARVVLLIRVAGGATAGSLRPRRLFSLLEYRAWCGARQGISRRR